jgi:hypothetical protein
MSKLIGNAILSILTIIIFFFGIFSVLFISYSIFLWILILGIAITLYVIAIIKVSKHFGLPLDEKLSDLSPVHVASLEIVFPGIGFVYMGKQNQRNYTLIGLAIFSIYLIAALLIIFSPFINYTGYYIFIFRVITPIIAYRTVKKLKG